MAPKLDKPLKKPRVWPGMPTRRSEMFELFVGLFPAWLALIGVTMALMMPLIQSCRKVAIEDVKQSRRSNAANQSPEP